MVRLVAHRIINGVDLTFSKKEYSQFKYGKESLAEQFALELLARTWTSVSTQINAINKEKINIVIYGAPFNEIPVASTILAENYANLLNKMSNKYNVSVGKISRQHSYHDDYGKMCADKRMESLSGETFEFVTDPNEYDVAIFIDDIFITGAHETRVQALIERSNVTSKVIFMYYAKLDNSDIKADFESELNTAAINDNDSIIGHFKEIFNDFNCQYNTRTVKFLLSQDFSLLKEIFKNSDVSLMKEFVAYAEMNGYYKHELYAQNYKNFVEYFLTED